MSDFAPAIVLVRPQMGENIGAVARAMMNFGLSELRIVAPRDGWPNPKAIEMAAHAAGIIAEAKLYDSLAEALADRHLVLASSARPRAISLPVYAPESGIAELRRAEAAGRSSALLFGPERSGLATDDLARSHGVITIPTDPRNPSLNLAQSAVLLGYLWFSSISPAEKNSLAADPPAELREIDGLLDHLCTALDRRDYFHVPAKRAGMARNLRLMLQKTGWNAQEIRTFRGIVRALDEDAPS